MNKEAVPFVALDLWKPEFQSRYLIASDSSIKDEEVARPDIEVESLDPASGPEWDRIVLSHPDASFFHTSAWARVLINTYSHRPFYLHCSKRGKSLALVPLMEVASPLTGRRGVCLPFSDFCEPLLFPGADGPSLLRRLHALARERRWRYFELRGEAGMAAEKHSPPIFYGHTLDLRAGTARLFSQLASPVRRAIRKGESSNLTVHVEVTLRALEEFVALHALTRKRHGVPPQPARFFSQIYQQILRPGLGFVVMARRDAIAVAAALFFVANGKAIYKFGASNQTGQSLRGNNLVMWSAIRHLVASQVQQLDLGRTAIEHEGLRRFKLGWGTNERPIDYVRFQTKSRACLQVASRRAGISARFFSRMPVTVNQVAGRLLYPHLD